MIIRKNFLLAFLLNVFISGFAFAPFAYSEVIINDTFEKDFSQWTIVKNVEISNEVAHTGSYSAKITYRHHEDRGILEKSGFTADKSLYTRHYIYMGPYDWTVYSNKIARHGDGGGYNYLGPMLWPSADGFYLAAWVSGDISCPYAHKVFYENGLYKVSVYGVGLRQGVWQKHEMYAKIHDPGQQNGYIEYRINDNVILRVANAVLRTDRFGICTFGLNMSNLGKDPDPVSYLYHDDIYVAINEGPPWEGSDTTPPNPPLGVEVKDQ